MEASKEHTSLCSVSGWLACAPDHVHRAVCVYDLTVVQKLPGYQVQWLRVWALQGQVTQHLCFPPGLIRVEDPEWDFSHRDSLMK